MEDDAVVGRFLISVMRALRLVVLASLLVATGARADEPTKPTSNDAAPELVPGALPAEISRKLDAPVTCVADNECRKDESCEDGRCVRGKITHAWPFFGSKPGSDGYKYIPPFLYFERKSGDTTTRVQFPFLVQRSNQATGEKSTVVPPLLFGWWNGAKQGTGGVWVGPFVTTRNEERSLTTLFPVFWNHHNLKTSARTNVLFPIAAFHTAKNPGEKTWGAVGPVFGWSGKADE